MSIRSRCRLALAMTESFGACVAGAHRNRTLRPNRQAVAVSDEAGWPTDNPLGATSNHVPCVSNATNNDACISSSSRKLTDVMNDAG